MYNIPELSQLLVELGLGKSEASAYVQLLLLAADGPATGYQVAKALGKNPTTVYNALEELLKRGAVETVAGRGRQFRPISPEALTSNLQRDYDERIQYTKEQLTHLPQPASDDEVFRLHSQSQVLSRFAELLRNCEDVALLDLAPDMLDRFLDEIAAAARRGVSVVIKLYAEPTSAQLCRLAEILFTVECAVDVRLTPRPGVILSGVFDCRRHLVTYLPRTWREVAPGDDAPVPEAFWTANHFLAYQAHAGLASEIIHTELRAMLAGGNDAGEMKAREGWLAARIYGPVDWEKFWAESGWGAVAGGPELAGRTTR